MKKSRKPKHPAGLSALARAWWDRITSEFVLDDSAALFLLESGLRSFDRMNEAASIIAKHGVVVADKYGQLKSNPATSVERDSRAAMHAAFKQLNLDVEPLRAHAGRPPVNWTPANAN